jgi:hypothetical protein
VSSSRFRSTGSWATPDHGAVTLDLTAVDLPTEVVRTDRLVLRPFGLEDVDAVFRASQDPETQRWISAIPVPYTREAARAFVEDVAMRQRAEISGLSSVIEAGGELAGTLGSPSEPAGSGPRSATPSHRGPAGAATPPRPRAGSRSGRWVTERRRPEHGVAGRRPEGGVHAGGRGALVPGLPGRLSRGRRAVRATARRLSGAGGRRWTPSRRAQVVVTVCASACRTCTVPAPFWATSTSRISP